jgi:ethanolamine utilization protein EutN
MYLGKVIGRVVSTVKDPALEGRKLLLIRRLPNGPAVVAIDAVGAGAGETVYVCRGREAAFAFKPEEVPTEAAGVKILLIQPLDLEGQPMGDVVVALDAVDAGVGDKVLAVQEGFSAMTSVGHVESPIDAAVIGVVDLVEFV